MLDVTVLDSDDKVVFNAGPARPGAYANRVDYLVRAQAAGFQVCANKVLASRKDIWDALDT